MTHDRNAKINIIIEPKPINNIKRTALHEKVLINLKCQNVEGCLREGFNREDAPKREEIINRQSQQLMNKHKHQTNQLIVFNPST